VSETRQAIEPTIKAMFQNIWTGLGDALAAMPRWEKGFHIFWLLGPFILLIERSPADIWLSVLAIAFVIRSIFKRDGAWLRAFWVRACFLFLAVCMVSSAMSAMPSYAFSLRGLHGFAFPYLRWEPPFGLARTSASLYAMLDIKRV
jgi:hypothetical protein